MKELFGLHEALINLHNEKMMVIAGLELQIRVLMKKQPEDIVAKVPLKSSIAGTGYQSVTAEQMIKARQQELDAEYRVLAVIKEMIQEGDLANTST